MASTNGSQSTFLKPARAASTAGVRVFDVGESLPLSSDQKELLKSFLARIIERYPTRDGAPAPPPSASEPILSEPTASDADGTDDTAH